MLTIFSSLHPEWLLNRFLFHNNKIVLLLFPKQCSHRSGNVPCRYPPSEVISVVTESGEYMVGVACSEHRNEVKRYVMQLQNREEIPNGIIRLQDIKIVTTDCVKVY